MMPALVSSSDRLQRRRAFRLAALVMLVLGIGISAAHDHHHQDMVVDCVICVSGNAQALPAPEIFAGLIVEPDDPIRPAVPRSSPGPVGAVLVGLPPPRSPPASHIIG